MSKCIICYHLRTQPSVYGDQVWCRENVVLGRVHINHPFINVERACNRFDEFDGEEPEQYYRPPMEG